MMHDVSKWHDRQADDLARRRHTICARTDRLDVLLYFTVKKNPLTSGQCHVMHAIVGASGQSHVACLYDNTSAGAGLVLEGEHE